MTNSTGVIYTATAPAAGNIVTKTVSGTTFTLPDVTVIVVASYVTLQSVTGIILLPSPLFGDTQNPVGAININRMVNGALYTYVKTTGRTKLSYKFELKRQKSYELQTFLDNNDIQWLTMTNFKGEVWKVKITNNPIIFEATGRGYVNAVTGPYKNMCQGNQEVHQVTLEFDGFLVSGASATCTVNK